MNEPFFFIFAFTWFNTRPWLAEFNRICLLSDLINCSSSLYDLTHSSSDDVFGSYTSVNRISADHELFRIFLISSRCDLLLLVLFNSLMNTFIGRCWYLFSKTYICSLSFCILWIFDPEPLHKLCKFRSECLKCSLVPET